MAAYCFKPSVIQPRFRAAKCDVVKETCGQWR